MSTRSQRKRQGGRQVRGGPARRDTAVAEPPLLNERIRRGGKWVFLGLVIVFAVSTVLAGVGASNSAPTLLDYLQNRSADEAAAPAEDRTPNRLREAREATKAKPNDAAAWVALGEVYANLPAQDATIAARNHEEAAKAFERAVKLKPNDVDLQRRLAESYAVQAGDASSQIQRLYTEAQQLTAAGSTDALVVPGGGANADSFTKARQEIVSRQANEIYQKAAPYQQALEAATTKAVAAYQKVAAARPNDGDVLFTLGSVAASGGDTKTAIEAYEKFLKLFPGDPVSDQVKETVKQLKQQNAPPPTDTTGTTDSAG